MIDAIYGFGNNLIAAPWWTGAGWPVIWTLIKIVCVVLPLMGPGVLVVTVFTFIADWGNFFVPFMLLLSPDQLPASVSIYTFFGTHGTVVYGQLAAFSVLYSLPVVLLYVLIARRLGGGFALGGALKG